MIAIPGSGPSVRSHGPAAVLHGSRHIDQAILQRLVKRYNSESVSRRSSANNLRQAGRSALMTSHMSSSLHTIPPSFTLLTDPALMSAGAVDLLSPGHIMLGQSPIHHRPFGKAPCQTQQDCLQEPQTSLLSSYRCRANLHYSLSFLRCPLISLFHFTSLCFFFLSSPSTALRWHA